MSSVSKMSDVDLLKYRNDLKRDIANLDNNQMSIKIL